MNRIKVETIDVEKERADGRLLEAFAVKLNEMIMRFNEAYCSRYY